MIALPPLLGYPEFTDLDQMLQAAISDLQALTLGGVDGVCLENDFDKPHRLTVDPEQIACFTRVAHEVALHAKVPMGLQVLLNDWRASLAIAKAVNAQFVRLDFFVDRVRIKAGVIEPNPAAILAYRKHIRAEQVALLTDIQVKHSEPLEPDKSIGTSARQALAHQADAVVITGTSTGQPPSLIDLRQAREAIHDFPILVGSGMSEKNARELMQHADGAIVGTAFKKSFRANEPVEIERVRRLVSAAK